MKNELKTTVGLIHERMKEFEIDLSNVLGAVRKDIQNDDIIVLNPKTNTWHELWSNKAVPVSVTSANYPIVFIQNLLFSPTVKILKTERENHVVYSHGEDVISPGIGNCKLIEVTLLVDDKTAKEMWVKGIEKIDEVLHEVWPTVYYTSPRNCAILEKSTNDLIFEYTRGFEHGTVVEIPAPGLQTKTIKNLDDLPIDLIKGLTIRDSFGWGWIEVDDEMNVVRFGIGEYGSLLNDTAELDQEVGYIPGAPIKNDEGKTIYGCEWRIGIPRTSFPLHSPECSEKLKLTIYLGGTVEHQF